MNARMTTMTVCVPASRRDEAQCGREAVGGRGRGDTDDDARNQAERAALQALIEHFAVVVLDLGGVGDHEHLGSCGRRRHQRILNPPVIALIPSHDKGFRGLDLIARPFRW